MKGIPLLASITSPKEGMQAIAEIDGFPKLLEVTRIGSPANLKYPWQKLVLEIEEEENLDRNEINNKFFPSKIRKAIPIHPDDWEYALKHIGEEIEFEEDLETKEIGRMIVDGSSVSVEKGTIVAKLIYTESWDELLNIFFKTTESHNAGLHHFIKKMKENYHPPKKI